jgi:hypothetical protein
MLKDLEKNFPDFQSHDFSHGLFTGWQMVSELAVFWMM